MHDSSKEIVNVEGAMAYQVYNIKDYIYKHFT
jgi:hypothetical protein